MSEIDSAGDTKSLAVRALAEERLREAILSGELRPGQRLNEKQLGTRFRVGRTSLREALRSLEAEGLLMAKGQRGMLVREIDVAEASQIYAVRIVLECFAVKEFVKHGTDDEIDQLEQSVDDFEAAATSKIPGHLLAVKNRFYDVLLTGCGNQIVCEMLRLIHNRVNLLRAATMSREARRQKIIPELRAIVSAVRERNEQQAVEECRRHLENAAREAISIMNRG